MWSPSNSMSSPVLTTTVRSCGGMARTRPRRNLAAPTPPARATITERSQRSDHGATTMIRDPTIASMTLDRAYVKEIARLLDPHGPPLDELCAAATAVREGARGRHK